jgi:hypothetical protein
MQRSSRLRHILGPRPSSGTRLRAQRRSAADRMLSCSSSHMQEFKPKGTLLEGAGAHRHNRPILGRRTAKRTTQRTVPTNAVLDSRQLLSPSDGGSGAVDGKEDGRSSTTRVGCFASKDCGTTAASLVGKQASKHERRRRVQAAFRKDMNSGNEEEIRNVRQLPG